MIRLIIVLIVPYLAIASVATGAVNGGDAIEHVRTLLGDVSEQSDDVASAIVYGGGERDHRVTVCHVPGGDPSRALLLSVSMEALPAHIKHGDYTLEAEELQSGPLSVACAASQPLEFEEPEANGNAPEHSNAGGNGGPPDHSNAGGNGNGPKSTH